LAKSDPEQLRAFINTQLAQTWKTQAQSVGEIAWLSRQEDYTANTVPNGVGLITAGVDVQVDRLECEVVGWGLADESWSLDYLVIQGNPNSPLPWESLSQLLDKVYQRKDGLKMRINGMAVDSGYLPQEAYAFARKHANRNVYAVKGQQGEGLMIFAKKYSKGKGGGRVYMLGVDSAKDKFYNLLAVKEHGPGFQHYPMDRDQTYFEGLTAEVYTVKYKKGRPYKVWEVKSGIRNEPLDTRVYAMAARYSFATLDMKKRMDTLDAKAKLVVKDDVIADPLPKVAPEQARPKTLATPKRPMFPRQGGMKDFINSLG
jgi:phage terminase large subunit GpA-like protein